MQSSNRALIARPPPQTKRFGGEGGRYLHQPQILPMLFFLTAAYADVAANVGDVSAVKVPNAATLDASIVTVASDAAVAHEDGDNGNTVTAARNGVPFYFGQFTHFTVLLEHKRDIAGYRQPLCDSNDKRMLALINDESG
jgi:hypothetical protein